MFFALSKLHQHLLSPTLKAFLVSEKPRKGENTTITRRLILKTRTLSIQGGAQESQRLPPQKKIFGPSKRNNFLSSKNLFSSSAPERHKGFHLPYKKTGQLQVKKN